MAYQLQRNTTNHFVMPEKKTIKAAQRAKREDKAPSTQAGEFVREEKAARTRVRRTS